MKTATKFLSMLLLVAMCLSLMGGSAYALSLDDGGALDLPVEGPSAAPVESPSAAPVEGGSSDLAISGTEPANNGSTTLALDEPSVMNAAELIWNGSYANLNTAAQNTTDIKLHDDANNSVSDPGGTISRSVTIDLNGKTLSFTGPLAVSANITIKNGKLENPSMITVGKGYKITTADVDMNGGNFSGEGGSSVIEDYIATIGTEKFATMDAAFAYAAMQTGTVTINVIDDSSKLQNYPVSTLPTTMSCSAIVLNLGKNCLEGSLAAPVPLTINGGKIIGGVSASSGSVTLNNTEVTGTVDVTGRTLSVNSSKVGEVHLSGGSLSMGSGSEIGRLVVNDNNGGQSYLNVSGGVVKALEYGGGGEAQRTVTGGEWYVNNNATALSYLRNCVAAGLELKGTKDPYTVGNGSGDSGSVTGNFTVYGSPYTKGSGNSVYVMMPYTSSTGSYYWSTVSNPSNTSQISTIASSYCSVTSTGGQYKLTLGNGFLDSLSAGTIYLWTGHDGKYTSMGSLTIQGNGGTIVNPGTASVWPVEDTWYSGSGMFYFYVQPDMQLVDGDKYDYYDVRIDNMSIGGDKISYNGYQKFGISSSVMDTLATGNHTITVLTTNGYASGSFRVGATLRAVDTDKHVTGSSKNLQFVCSDSISRVWVGRNELTQYNYGDYWTLSSSGKTITLTSKFLNSQLVAGNTYTITVQTANGDQPSCNFQILTTAQASSSPRTGDESNLALWAALLVLAGGATVAVLPRLKKNED